MHLTLDHLRITRQTLCRARRICLRPEGQHLSPKFELADCASPHDSEDVARGDQPQTPLPPGQVACLEWIYIILIGFSVLSPLIGRAVIVSWIDTPILSVMVSALVWWALKLDLQLSIIMSGATMICGSSAAMALSSSMGATRKAELQIAILSIFKPASISMRDYLRLSLHSPPYTCIKS
ncbi:hypothetical protein SeMB42_g00512 [Synchytrium endobioticum]|uniref:Uncharacterized protein n=1 Tax=Synchytrium endobioticum TaxID=286115 RepID=A0A507DRX6_9FUNG|nr:hypothetical protein SeMB42_g00512 [Synchytrium endobioticum]